jgi:ComF family protein
MTTWWSAFVDLLFPRLCPACETALVGTEAIVCTACQVALPRSAPDLAAAPSPLARKFHGKVALASAQAYLQFRKGGRVQALLHALKYRNQPEVGHWLGRQYGTELRANGYAPAADLIVPVPLHRARQRVRLYNQSERFAAGLSDTLGIPYEPHALQKVKKTDSQTRKSRMERYENVADVFTLRHPEQIRNRSILLVDDVVTTGATLEAAATVLLSGGCREVHLLAIATAQ